jgi:hypothetical protein
MLAPNRSLAFANAASLIDGYHMKTCPDCAESVQEDAKFCRTCGHSFEGRLALLEKHDRFKVGCIVILLVVLFITANSALTRSEEQSPLPAIPV